MAQEFGTPITPNQEPKKRNTGLIIAIILLVVLCCCLVVGGLGWYLWTYGDQIFGLTKIMGPLLI